MRPNHDASCYLPSNKGFISQPLLPPGVSVPSKHFSNVKAAFVDPGTVWGAASDTERTWNTCRNANGENRP